MSSPYSGRLELTWTNKHLRLLSREDGGYEWVPPSDYRVAEVRLLRDAGTTGDVQPEAGRAHDNLLIRGDALAALTSLAGLPEFSAEIVGKVKLAYLDPPFNTQQAFAHYDDALEHSVWLTMMRDRLQQIRKLLASDGSVWVHLDDTEMAYCRVMMDEMFGRANFVATVIWQKVYATRNDARHFSTDHDYILVYAKDVEVLASNRLARTASADALYKNPDDDPRGAWMSDNYTCAKSAEERPNLFYPIVNPNTGDEIWPSRSRVWLHSQERHLLNERENRVWWGEAGTNGTPRYKRFLSDVPDLIPGTFWPHSDVGHTQDSKREIKSLFPDSLPFATPKPERLMHRIVHIASNPGDLVLDCFAGSGTTAAVAHKMGRRWITVEWSRETVETFTAPRLAKVVAGDDPGGVTEQTGWEGGGGFRVLDVAPTMFDEEEGQVLLADWAFGTDLSEATAAQLGFEYDADLLPFCGKKGRLRLAVVDGLVNEAVARLLLQELPAEERLCVCGTMVDPLVRDVLRSQRPGSTVRKVPESILADYRLGQLWWDAHAADVEEPAEVEA